MIKKGEYIKAFKCYSDSLYIFRMEKFDDKGVYLKINSEVEICFSWQFVTRLNEVEGDALCLKK